MNAINANDARGCRNLILWTLAGLTGMSILITRRPTVEPLNHPMSAIQDSAEATPKDDSDEPIWLVHAQIGDTGLWSLPFRINGRPVTGVLDTGASAIAVPTSMASQLGIDLDKTTPSKVTLANGSTVQVYATDACVQLGPLTLEHCVVGLTREVDGQGMVLIGQSLLEHFSWGVEFDGVFTIYACDLDVTIH